LPTYLGPPGGTDLAGQTSVADYACDMEILDNDHTKACGQCRREPMEGIFTLIRNRCVQVGDFAARTPPSL
jgi:hypothetical protein